MTVYKRALYTVASVIDCSLFSTEPFRVAFVQTMYTVTEGDTVEVCVNLTHPPLDTDILDERVFVRVINDPNSTYIPPDAVLASEPL